MKVPMSWLRELVELPEDLDASQLAAIFTDLGLTVEHLSTTGPDVTGPLTIGRVLSFTEEPQKNGKVIRYCRVDVGAHNDQPTHEFPASRGIVCGAHNFTDGDLVVVALPGTVLPGNFEISARKTYGHISDGMICAEDELGLGADHSGIIVLDPVRGFKPGDDALDALWSRDQVFELDVTPDLGYCMSMRGVSREAAIGCGVSFRDPYSERLPEPTTGGVPVVLESERCQVFVALSIDNVDLAAPTPSFMADRLRACGIRSISLPVDVTNYVMLESGQPLHAYDGDKLTGAIRVRTANEGEQLVTLDGHNRTLHPDDLLIVDDNGPIGLAGVMGGEETEISAATNTIVLESACFDSASISRTFRRHGLPSEASKRYERGVDPGLAWAAAKRAAELLEQYGGATVRDQYTVAGKAPNKHKLNVRSGLVGAVLGAPVSHDQVVQILQASGIHVTAMSDSLTLEIPSWRLDLRDPYDIVEEVGRKYGYNKIGLRLPIPKAGRGLTRQQRDRRAVINAVAALGFTELLTLPFISAEDFDKLGMAADDSRRRAVRLANPLAETQPYLRTSLLPGLFSAVVRNVSRGLEDVFVFECGARYFDLGTRQAPRPSVAGRPSEQELAELEAALPSQPETLAAVVTGQWVRAGWQGEAVAANWTHVVAFAQVAASAVGLEVRRVQESGVSPWHPGRCARVMLGETTLGFAGELHPQVIAAYGLPARTCAVELDLGELLAAAPTASRIGALSALPIAKEDVALIVDASVSASDVQEALVEGAGELLESVHLFDVYVGEQVGQGRKSLAFALRFRGDATLTDAETAKARQAAVNVAVERFGAQQRA